jgi:hypothetical protein
MAIRTQLPAGFPVVRYAGTAAMLIAALLGAGCGAVGSDLESDSGQMVAIYQDATTPAARDGRRLMTDAHMLEDMARYVNSYLRLPYSVALVGAQCNEANAFWNAGDKKITICYEYADLMLNLFKASSDGGVADPARAAVNAQIATAYHELGHAIIAIYDLPATGSHEDAADQLAAYMWLVPDENIKNDAPQVVVDYAEMLKQHALTRRTLSVVDFADEHPPDMTRMYNLACWVYGSNPAAHADLIAHVGLPDERATRCEWEFQNLTKAWNALLEPHLK